MTRFRLTITPADSGWEASITCPTNPAWPSIQRRIEVGDQGYPRPPVGELLYWGPDTPPLYRDTRDDQLRQAHERCLRGAPDRTKKEVVAFGRYLFAVMLGSSWPLLMSSKAQGETVELEFDLSGTNAPLLQRLPWEMMCAEQGPLAGLPMKGGRVAMSRVVRMRKATGIRPIEIPLRVLFIVGRQMDDALRPGAEYLNLLRQFEVQLGTPKNESVGVALHTRLLLSATRDDVIFAIQQFKPAVVHIISHGRWNGRQAEIVFTKMDGDNPAEDGLTAENLLGLLQHDSIVQAVVLNACNTAQPSDADSHLSYAGELVAGGIPVVIGMAGEVTDSVCRLFTTSFYRALYENMSIPLAVAEGRRAALLQYGSYSTNVEWARPVLHVADGIQCTFATNHALQKVATAARGFRKRKDDFLCDRLDYLRDLERICARQVVNLALPVQEPAGDSHGTLPIQLGKTWLLEEMAWMAVLERYLPCFLASSNTKDPPSSYLEFALLLTDAVNRSRRVLELPLTLRTAVVRALYFELGWNIPADDGELELDYGRARKELENLDTITATDEAIHQRILQDLGQFLADGEKEIGAEGVLILIDDLHRYEGVWQPLLESVGRYGLGERASPAPLVFTYSTRAKAGPHIVNFLQQNSSLFDVRPLTRFRVGPERMMAYRQSLLSRKLVPTMDPVLIDKGFVAKMFDRFEKLTLGIPSYLQLPKLIDQLEVDIDNEVLVTSDDAAIIAAARKFDV